MIDKKKKCDRMSVSSSLKFQITAQGNAMLKCGEGSISMVDGAVVFEVCEPITVINNMGTLKNSHCYYSVSPLNQKLRG